MLQRVEVITGKERRRRWSDDEKLPLAERAGRRPAAQRGAALGPAGGAGLAARSRAAAGCGAHGAELIEKPPRRASTGSQTGAGRDSLWV